MVELPIPFIELIKPNEEEKNRRTRKKLTLNIVDVNYEHSLLKIRVASNFLESFTHLD